MYSNINISKFMFLRAEMYLYLSKYPTFDLNCSFQHIRVSECTSRENFLYFLAFHLSEGEGVNNDSLNIVKNLKLVL